jgi:hypothetical protein
MADGLEQAQVLEQLALVAQGIQRAAHAQAFGAARVAQGVLGQTYGPADVVAQLLRSQGAEEGRPHILQQQVHGLALALAGRQRAVALLASGVVAQAQVEQTPGELQAAERA